MNLILQNQQKIYFYLLSTRKEKYRLGTIDSILDTITQRNAEFFSIYKTFRKNYEVVEKQAGHFRKLYNNVA